MHREQRQRTQAVLRANGLHHALFANFHSVKWLTGFNPPIQVGPFLFAGGPPLVWYEDGRFTLVIPDSHLPQAEGFGGEPDGAVVTYQGYSLSPILNPAANLQAALRSLLPAAANGKVGIEETDATALVWWLLHDRFGESVAIDGWLEPLRMVKTAEELTKLRANFALTDLGQAVARRTVAAGQREIEVWTAVHSAIQEQASQRVPLGNDCVVNRRPVNNIGGWPLDYTLGQQDSLIVDLSTQLHGYWSDSCATYYVGEPTAKQRAMHQTATAALEFAISLVRPGAVSGDIDRQVRQFIRDAGYPVYPHHTGHGVGVSGHEAPRLVPGNDQVLEPGMVIMVEPGIYFPGEAAVRLEDGLLVTADGAELLTNFDKSIG